ncbi:MAG: type II toxin-antitoxin system prevent-host-death family antitoxin [Methylococcales bacterium]|nr:type II toxin-antitoxin system prevent-host-death family antitoxin [Methylococcales bacterium]
MQTVNIHEAKTQLSRLIEQAVKGDSFIIAKAGKPLVKVIRLDAPSAGQIRRLGNVHKITYATSEIVASGMAV